MKQYIVEKLVSVDGWWEEQKPNMQMLFVTLAKNLSLQQATEMSQRHNAVCREMM